MRFSIVTPVFNAERYLGEMLDSVRRQSLPDWELRIVDDGSSDSSRSLIAEAAEADPRIKPLFLDSNSGSCFLPRRRAIEAAEGEYVVNIDADDVVEPDYLKKLDAVIASTGADLVYADMYIFEGVKAGKDGAQKVIPSAPDVYGKTFKGRDIFFRSLDRWDVSGVCATKKTLAVESLALFTEKFGRGEAPGNFHDENLTRLDLFLARRVAFAPAAYFYRTVPSSVTHTPGLARLELLEADRDLNRFVRGHYGVGAREYRMVQRQLFHRVIESMRILNVASGAESRHVGAVFEAYRDIDFRAVRPAVSPRYWFLLRSGFGPARFVLRFYGRK